MSEDIVEEVVCRAEEVEEGGTKEVELEGEKLLLVRQDGLLTALSGKCTHYGAPLVKGSFGEGIVRCPWHGACFSTCLLYTSPSPRDS